MTTDIHVICKHGQNFKNLGNSIFETGDWAVSDATASESIGGRVYLHEKQKDAAWHGGVIMSWAHATEHGRKILTYKVDGPFRLKHLEGWSQEIAIVRNLSGICGLS